MSEKSKKFNPKLHALLKNIGVGYYNFKSKPVPESVPEKEILTAGKMRNLFGASYENIVYFNFDTESWNRSRYLGFTIGNQAVDARDAMEMKRVLEQKPEMQQLEVVASVTMATPDSEYPGTGNIAKNPIYKRSANIVGTLILRDKTTGKILPVAPCWVGVEDYKKMSIAAFYGSDGLAYKLASDGVLCDRFVSELMRQVQR